MEAHIKTLEELFEPLVQYAAPTHQRRYAWGEERQWEPLWKDLLWVAERLLPRPAEPVPPHFLGPIVIASGTHEESGVVRHDVIDGQQRLTTMQILTHVVAHELQYSPTWSDSNDIERLVRNAGVSHESEASLKVLPNRADHSAYDVAMSRGVVTEPPVGAHPILKAWHFFYRSLQEWMTGEEQEEDREHRVQVLSQALRTGMRVAVVKLASEDDPHRVFETMNARGEPLTAYDLVKNHLLHRADQEGRNQETMYATYLGWSDDDMWNASTGKGAKKRPLIDQFLYDWLQLRSDDEVRRANLYREYRERTDDLPVSVEELLSELMLYAKVFDELVSEGSAIRSAHPAFFQWLRHKAPQHAFSPTLMWLFRANSDRAVMDEDVFKVLRILEIFLARRAVCDLGTTGYRHLGRRYSRHLADVTRTDSAVERLVGLLRDVASPGWVVPTDLELRHRLETEPTGEPNARWMVWLLKCMLDRQPGAVPRDDNVRLFGVRIIPKDCSAQSWPRPADRTDDFWQGPEALEEKCRTVENMLGNYTLATKNLDRASPSQDWTARSLELKNSALMLMPSDRELFAQPSIDYNDILRRTRQMTQLICEIWPHPSEGQTWGTQE